MDIIRFAALRGSARFCIGTSMAAVALCALATPAFAQDAAKSSKSDETKCVAGDGTGDANCTSDAATQGESSVTEVNANGEPATANAIVVTGSRIARPNYDTVEPSVVIGSDEIEARGFETLGQALNEQPSFGVPGSSPVGGQSDFGQAQSFVNFLGLGSQRTLTLVNSKRFVSSNTATIFGPTGAGSQVDLNLIPTKLIERVQTIAVGGAPIYGADAIAGTINVILKEDYQGIDLDGQYGISSRGDAGNYRFRLLAGTNFADGKGNVVISGEYNNGDGLTYSDRAVTASGLFFRNANDPNSSSIRQLYTDRRIPSIATTGIPYVGSFFDINLSPDQLTTVPFFNAPDYDGNGIPGTFNDYTVAFGGVSGTGVGTVDQGTDQLKFDTNGNLVPINFGTYAGRPGSFGIDFSGGNGYSLVPVSNLLSRTERYSAIMLANYAFSDTFRFHGEAWYSRSTGVNLRSQPVYNTGLFDSPGTPDGSIIISINNPFLTPQARAAIQDSINNNVWSDQNFGVPNQDYFYLGRANTDLATGESRGSVEVLRFVGAFDGNFTLFGNEWNWEAYANYGRSLTKGRSRELIQQNFLNAVDAVIDPNTGQIVCRPGYTSAPIPSINPTCAPLNLFGTGQSSQEALDYVSAIANPRSFNQLTDFVADVSGPMFKLPGGDFSISLGYEHRRESQDFDPGDFFRGELQTNGTYTSYGRSVAIANVYGSYHTNELFGEFLAEVISPSNNAFIDLLEVKGAARYVDHSVAGGDWTWTLGGRLGILGVTFRGNYTRSIRAPAITEAFNPSSSYYGFAVDPCDASELNNGPDPATRAANCAAAGITQPFSALSNQRSFSQAISGNPLLNNEKADSWTVGAVIQPKFIPHLRLTVDYVDIKLKDVISQLSGSQVVANCYDSTNFPNNQFCARLSRDSSGQLDFIETGYFNSALMRYKGILGALEYRIPEVMGGEIGAKISYQYLDTLASQSDVGQAPSQTDDSIGYSKHQGVLTIAYNNKQFGLFTQASYIGATHINPQVVPNYYPAGMNDIPAIVFVNLGANFNVDDRFTLRLVVDNVFDQKPPYPYPATGGTITYFRGVLGTFFRIGAEVKF